MNTRKFFQRPQIALALRARAILLAFEKIYSCLFIPNCTRNHVITCTTTNNNLINNNKKQVLQSSVLKRYMCLLLWLQGAKNSTFKIQLTTDNLNPR